MWLPAAPTAPEEIVTRHPGDPIVPEETGMPRIAGRDARESAAVGVESMSLTLGV
jgi:hypothetical protein